MKKILVNFACGLMFIFLLSINIFASYCACCSEKGYYSISYSKPDSYHLGLLNDMKFSSTATLYQDAGGEDNIKGISNIADNYDFTGSFLNPKWGFTFKTGNKSGVLTLPIPLKMINYKVDTHENEENQGDPVLYKEWRFEGATTGTGIFQAGIVPMTKYFLVLQGRGNLCDNAEDFTHWRLEITGKKASYAFFGKMKTN
jgi:hypothetical protein